MAVRPDPGAERRASPGDAESPRVEEVERARPGRGPEVEEGAALRVLPGGREGEPREPDRSVSVGQALRAAREARGISIERAAEDTKIAPRYLEALEADASSDAFPSPVYGSFFLRGYARYLGLDERPLVEAFRSKNEEPAPDLEELPAPLLPARGPWFARVVIFLSVAALIGIAAYNVTRPRSQAQPSSVPKTAPSPTAQARSPAPSPSRTAPPPVQVMRAVLRVDQRSWTMVTADGRTVVAETLLPGRVVTVRARHTLRVDLGWAGGVRLTINGKRIPTGAPGQVVHLCFELHQGKVLKSTC